MDSFPDMNFARKFALTDKLTDQTTDTPARDQICPQVKTCKTIGNFEISETFFSAGKSKAMLWLPIG